MNIEPQCSNASDAPRPRPKSLLLSKHTWLLSTWPSVSSDGSVCIPAHYHGDSSSRPGSCVGWEGLKLFSEASGLLTEQDVQQGVAGSPSNSAVELCCTAHKPPTVKRLVKSVTQGLKAFQEPERAINGMGGTYFFLDEAGRKAAILKPCDEEPLAPNNPNGFVGRALGDPGWKPTVRVGEAAMREVAAYLLDHDHFACVPCTVLVRARHACFHHAPPPLGTRSKSVNDAAALDGPVGEAQQLQALQHGGGASPFKLGSLQEYVRHDTDTSEMGASRFAVRDVHRIGILDVRLFNTDRHAGNILVRKVPASGAAAGFGKLPQTEYQLIPIDHGFCLPEALDAPYFEWLHWPQAAQAFGPEELAYIKALDIEADIALLRSELPSLRPECFCVLQVTTTLLQKCAAAGLSLMEIGALLTRPMLDRDDGDPSQLEQLCLLARAAVDGMAPEEEEEGGEEEEGEGAGGSSASGSGGSADREGEAWLEDSSMSSPGGVVPMARVNENEELLFDLEVEGHRRSLDLAGAGSTPPTPYSGLLSSSEQASPEGHAPGAVCPSPLACPPCLFDPATSGIQALSVSLCHHESERDCLSQHQAWGRYRKSRNNLTSPRPVCRADSGVRVLRYPPAVAGAAPQSVKDVFSSLTELQWQRFMAVLCHEMDACLERGDWRSTGAGERSVAASCPQF